MHNLSSTELELKQNYDRLLKVTTTYTERAIHFEFDYSTICNYNEKAVITDEGSKPEILLGCSKYQWRQD